MKPCQTKMVPPHDDAEMSRGGGLERETDPKGIQKNRGPARGEIQVGQGHLLPMGGKSNSVRQKEGESILCTEKKEKESGQDTVRKRRIGGERSNRLLCKGRKDRRKR